MVINVTLTCAKSQSLLDLNGGDELAGCISCLHHSDLLLSQACEKEQKSYLTSLRLIIYQYLHYLVSLHFS